MSSEVKTLFSQLFELPFKAALVRCLDEKGREITHATGFIRREAGRLFLYTCWHVVTGYDKNNVMIGRSLPERVSLSVEFQGVSRRPGVESIGGYQCVTIPLYDRVEPPRVAVWLQDNNHVPHPDLNQVGLFVPFWYDAVKIELPSSICASEVQLIEEDDFFPSNTLLTVGDKLYVVGYPYGFSAYGGGQPTPIALTRFIAATRVAGRPEEILLESIGAPGMSGGPVFIERGDRLHLLGMYTGIIYPDYAAGQNERSTALGCCANLSLHFWGGIEFSSTPSRVVQAKGS